MRVEKIELIGFKSFTDKTAFNLHPGITCIVGPNGCGKSNVVDAFKWVLGEQSAKSLRGDKMEEVIFNGSQTKKPKGMAEVTLYVSGLGESDNGEPETTTVTRRLYRSGDSDYMLNRDICRLKDIRDLFLDTGLEVKSYSILEQDRISAILSAKPEERRFLIEEVAGVVKYKVRRAEAHSKLESSTANLQRINDIIAEVKRQINFLDRQVKKAERYKKLMEEVKLIELKTDKNNYSLLNASFNELNEQYDSHRKEDIELRTEMTKTEVEIEVAKTAYLDKEKHLDTLQSEQMTKEKQLSEIERTIAVLMADRDNLKDYLSRLSTENETSLRKIKEAEERGRNLKELKESLIDEISSLKDELGAKNEALDINEDEMSEKEGLLDSKRKEIFAIAQERSSIKNELLIQESILENLNKKQDRIGLEYEDSKKLLDELNSMLAQIESLTNSKRNELLSLKEKKDSIVEEVNSHKQRLDDLRASLTSAKEELAGVTSRLESLRELVEGEQVVEISHIASVTDIIDVPPEYEKAIESGLREAIKGFILKSLEDVEPAAKLIREKNSERTALIPINSPSLHIQDKDLPPGSLGRALDFVRTKEDFSGIIKNLLGNVIVVKDLKTAIRMNSIGMNETHLCMVTLEGEVLEPSGAVIVGRGKGLLKLKRQIREIASEVEAKKSRIPSIQSEMNHILTSIREKEDSLHELDEGILNCDKELEASKLRYEKCMEDKERTERKLSYLEAEAEGIEREKEDIKKAIAIKQETLNHVDERKRQSDERISALQEEIASQLSLNSCNERLNSFDREFKEVSRLCEEVSQKIRFIEEESSLTESKTADKETDLRQKEAILKEIALKTNDLTKDISLLQEIISGGLEEVDVKEQTLKAMRGKIDALSHSLSGLEVARAEHKLRIENLRENARANYGVSLDDLVLDPPLPEDEERLESLRSKIQELGTVSMGSLDEYEELKSRYEFLIKQKNDIEQSISELEEAIVKINSTTRKRLKDAYDALRAKFEEIFTLLFGGGRAELNLTNENNILESGIDIVVQPPGKRLQNINLLSGGEKVLAALALLFGSFLIKPTPLCILDEADSALDEANTEKFSKMLKELAMDTQFIVITHNKITMESADYIYGITMEEPGSSKVISLELIGD
ncbi:MAG: chromosome segregation protein SMC [Nitrospirae bacterium]|nr:chromosome segregation protein SMC [Nitrospirota bacterium]